MDSDTLEKFRCAVCDRVWMDFGLPVSCPSCGSQILLPDNMVSTVLTSFGLNGNIYDSIETIKDDVDSEIERQEVEKELVQAEKLRRGVDVTGE